MQSTHTDNLLGTISSYVLNLLSEVDASVDGLTEINMGILETTRYTKVVKEIFKKYHITDNDIDSLVFNVNTLITACYFKVIQSIDLLDSLGFSVEPKIEKGTIAYRIKNTRINKGISQSKLSQVTGIHSSQVSSYESGTSVPDSNTILKLSNALNVTPLWLTTGVNTLEYCNLQPLKGNILEGFKQDSEINDLSDVVLVDSITSINGVSLVTDIVTNPIVRLAPTLNALCDQIKNHFNLQLALNDRPKMSCEYHFDPSTNTLSIYLGVRNTSAATISEAFNMSVETTFNGLDSIYLPNLDIWLNISPDYETGTLNILQVYKDYLINSFTGMLIGSDYETEDEDQEDED